MTIYTDCYNAEKGIFYYTTYQNHQISAVHLHNEPLDSDFLIRYPMITGEQTHYQNRQKEVAMSNITKRAIEQSLKNLLMKKPLTKITISDITADCGMNRMTFYYHFKDIYDLVEWVCLEDA